MCQVRACSARRRNRTGFFDGQVTCIRRQAQVGSLRRTEEVQAFEPPLHPASPIACPGEGDLLTALHGAGRRLGNRQGARPKRPSPLAVSRSGMDSSLERGVPKACCGPRSTGVSQAERLACRRRGPNEIRMVIGRTRGQRQETARTAITARNPDFILSSLAEFLRLRATPCPCDRGLQGHFARRRGPAG